MNAPLPPDKRQDGGNRRLASGDAHSSTKRRSMNGAQFYLPRVCFAGGATAFSEDEYQACSGSLRRGAQRAFGGPAGAKARPILRTLSAPFDFAQGRLQKPCPCYKAPSAGFSAACEAHVVSVAFSARLKSFPDTRRIFETGFREMESPGSGPSDLRSRQYIRPSSFVPRATGR